MTREIDVSASAKGSTAGGTLAVAQRPTADVVLAAIETLTGHEAAFADLYSARGQKLRADEPIDTSSELFVVFTAASSAELIRTITRWETSIRSPGPMG